MTRISVNASILLGYTEATGGLPSPVTRHPHQRVDVAHGVDRLLLHPSCVESVISPNNRHASDGSARPLRARSGHHSSSIENFPFRTPTHKMLTIHASL